MQAHPHLEQIALGMEPLGPGQSPFPELPLLQEVETATSFCFLCRSQPLDAADSKISLLLEVAKWAGRGAACDVVSRHRQVGSAQRWPVLASVPCACRPRVPQLPSCV